MLTRKRNSGNAMTEYSLIGLLVLTVCIGGLMNLGNGLQDNLGGFGKSLAYSQKAAPSALPTVNVVSPAAAVPSSSSLQAKPAQKVDLGTPAQTSETLQVSGANGATNELADALASRTDKLLATGEITQAQANLLYKLSNNGHSLANGQALFENALKAGQKSVAFEGKTYKLRDFANMLGYTKDTTQQENWSLNPDIAGPVMKPFSETYQEILQSGMLTDPNVKQQVNDITLQIGSLVDAFTWSANGAFDMNYASNQSLVDDFSASLVEHFKTNLNGAPIAQWSLPANASDFTHQGSASICGAGSGKDSGKACAGKG